MRKKEFNVPTEIILACRSFSEGRGDFAETLAEHSITNEIQGTTDDGEIIVEVQYEKEERQGVFELMEPIDDHLSEEED